MIFFVWNKIAFILVAKPQNLQILFNFICISFSQYSILVCLFMCMQKIHSHTKKSLYDHKHTLIGQSN